MSAMEFDWPPELGFVVKALTFRRHEEAPLLQVIDGWQDLIAAPEGFDALKGRVFVTAPEWQLLQDMMWFGGNYRHPRLAVDRKCLAFATDRMGRSLMWVVQGAIDRGAHEAIAEFEIEIVLRVVRMQSAA